MKTRKTRKAVVNLLVLIGLFGFSGAATAGDLQPPGTPNSTMKTLDEIEPRIPIPGANTPAATFYISQSGSYYLTGDRTSSETAIVVDVNDVTIDLMGYSIIGPGQGEGSYSGIFMNGRSNVEIRNGTIRNFGYPAIYESNNNGKEHRVISVRVVSSGYGIYLFSPGHLVKDCTAADNTSYGIYVYRGSTITGNVAYNNSSGIYTGSGCTVTGNTAYSNQSNGVYVGSGCTVTGNTAYNNQSNGVYVGNGCTVTGNTIYNNQSNGVYVGSGCTVTANTIKDNNQSDTAGYAGIRVNSDCLVKGNTVRANGENNIYVNSSDNAIEENLVTDCTSGYGIYFNLIGNFYANNRASGNSTNYGGTLPSGGGNGGGNASF